MWGTEYRVGGAALLQQQECCFTFVGPLPLLQLLCKIIQWLHNIGEVFDEGTVEVAKTQKAVHFFDGGGSLPFSNTLYFDGVHLDLSIADDHS